MSAQTYPTRQEIQADQERSLTNLVHAIANDNPFYRPRIEAADLPDPVDLNAFTERMPLTLKAELQRDQEANPPYGTNLTYPLSHYVRIHQTSSTTGKPLRWLDTRESWAWMTASWRQVLEAAGATADDVLFAAFSFGPFIAFWMAFEAAQEIGCLCIPGGAMNTSTRLRAMIANRATILCCTPTYALHLGEVAAREGVDLAQSAVRTIIVAGEPGGSLPAVRERLGRLWPNARIFDHHGMTEVGPVTFECPDRPGVLHVMEDAYLAEVIDPETEAAINRNGTHTGELVLTTLGRHGSPLLRFRTGDLVCPESPGVCACGRSTMTLSGGIIGRVDDMVVVRGVNLYPSAIDQIIHQHAGIAEFRIEVDERAAMTELRVVVEPASDCPDTTGLCNRLEHAFRDALNLRVPVTAAEPGSLPRFELKARRWIRHTPDRYNG